MNQNRYNTGAAFVADNRPEVIRIPEPADAADISAMRVPPRRMARCTGPRSTPEVEGYEFWTYYLAAGKVGGDFYDYWTLADGSLAVALGDAMGHGLAAALLEAAISGRSVLVSGAGFLAAIAARRVIHYNEQRRNELSPILLTDVSCLLPNFPQRSLPTCRKRCR